MRRLIADPSVTVAPLDPTLISIDVVDVNRQLGELPRIDTVLDDSTRLQLNDPVCFAMLVGNDNVNRISTNEFSNTAALS